MQISDTPALSCSAKAGHPVLTGLRAKLRASAITGSSACADDDKQGPRSQHPERVQVGLEDGLLLLALVDVLLAQPHHDAQRLDVEAVALGLGIDRSEERR